MANLSTFTPRPIELPQWILAGCSHKAAAILTVREKMIEFQQERVSTERGLGTRRFVTRFSSCLDIVQGSR